MKKNMSKLTFVMLFAFAMIVTNVSITKVYAGGTCTKNKVCDYVCYDGNIPIPGQNVVSMGQLVGVSRAECSNLRISNECLNHNIAVNYIACDLSDNETDTTCSYSVDNGVACRNGYTLSCDSSSTINGNVCVSTTTCNGACANKTVYSSYDSCKAAQSEEAQNDCQQDTTCGKFCAKTGTGGSGGQGGDVESYKITANANGGEITSTAGWTNASDNKSATKYVDKGKSYGTLPTVTKTDDTLKEWNTKSDGTGIVITSSSTANSAATIYAIWNSTSITITGITISPKPVEVEVGKTIQLTASVTPSNANQTVNWSSSDSTVATVDNNGKVVGVKVGVVTITATTQDGSKSDTVQVTVKAAGTGTTTHNITFNCNGGTGSMTPISVNFGQTVTLPTNACSRTGYTFNGWNTSANGNGTIYNNGASMDYTLNDDLELFAQWVRATSTYVVHYDSNGGSGNMSDTEANVGVSGTLKNNAFKYTGHTFVGWKAYYKNSNNNLVPLTNKDIDYKNKASFVNLFGPNEEDVTLYAQWKIVNPKTGIATPTAIIGGLLLISAFGYYLVKKKNVVLE